MIRKQTDRGRISSRYLAISANVRNKAVIRRAKRIRVERMVFNAAGDAPNTTLDPRMDFISPNRCLVFIILQLQ